MCNLELMSSVHIMLKTFDCSKKMKSLSLWRCFVNFPCSSLIMSITTFKVCNLLILGCIWRSLSLLTSEDCLACFMTVNWILAFLRWTTHILFLSSLSMLHHGICNHLFWCLWQSWSHNSDFCSLTSQW